MKQATIEEKLKTREWKKDEENLKKFNEAIELIKKYPTKLMKEYKSPPYALSR